jgi:LacI family repressor for deo operon, udp, cdd, tsx, nupC, and nupG
MARKTMKDVARLAGVSTATISRALTNPDMVRESTRERVLAAIDRIGYAPNVLARNLRRMRTSTVILLVRQIVNPFYLEIFRGVEAAARELGYNVLMSNAENSPERELEYFDMIRERRADGIILVTGKLPLRRGRGADLPPLVVASEYLPGLDLPTVRIDNVSAAAAAVAYLVGLGHRRIAHITGPLPEVLSRDRLKGYRKALRRAGIEPDDRLVARGDYTNRSGHGAAAGLLRGRRRPTAIFAANDEMAMGAIKAARERGLSVPADLSVVGFDDIAMAAAWDPALTTVAQPCGEMGSRAMILLSEILGGEDRHGEEIVLATRLVARGSTAPCRT